MSEQHQISVQQKKLHCRHRCHILLWVSTKSRLMQDAKRHHAFKWCCLSDELRYRGVHPSQPFKGHTSLECAHPRPGRTCLQVSSWTKWSHSTVQKTKLSGSVNSRHTIWNWNYKQGKAQLCCTFSRIHPKKAKPLAVTYTKQYVMLATWYHLGRSLTLLLLLLKPGPFSVVSGQAKDSVGSSPACRVSRLHLSLRISEASHRLGRLFSFLPLDLCFSTALNTFSLSQRPPHILGSLWSAETPLV